MENKRDSIKKTNNNSTIIKYQNTDNVVDDIYVL